MKANEFRDMTQQELEKKLQDLKEDLFTQRFRVSTGQQENTGVLKHLKRDIARALTVLEEMEQKETGASV